MPNSTQLDTRVLDNIIKNLPGNRRDAIRKVAFMLEARAKLNIQQMEAIDTGALLNSVGTSLQSGGTIESAMSEAKSRNPDAKIVPLPTPDNDHTAFVGPTVEYALEVHNGSGEMAARPYLLQAVWDTAGDFRKIVGNAVVDRG